MGELRIYYLLVGMGGRHLDGGNFARAFEREFAFRKGTEEGSRRAGVKSGYLTRILVIVRERRRILQGHGLTVGLKGRTVILPLVLPISSLLQDAFHALLEAMLVDGCRKPSLWRFLNVLNRLISQGHWLDACLILDY